MSEKRLRVAAPLDFFSNAPPFEDRFNVHALQVVGNRLAPLAVGLTWRSSASSSHPFLKEPAAFGISQPAPVPPC